MMLVLSLLLLGAAVAYILGKKEIAIRLGWGAVLVAAVIALFPCLLDSFAAEISGALGAIGCWSGKAISWFALMASACVGALAWRKRADRQKIRDAWSRRHCTPRARSLPAPPADGRRDGQPGPGREIR